jgi:hypothetical protein
MFASPETPLKPTSYIDIKKVIVVNESCGGWTYISKDIGKLWTKLRRGASPSGVGSTEVESHSKLFGIECPRRRTCAFA